MYIIISVVVAIIIVFVINTQSKTNKNVRLYGEAEDFLRYVILQLKVSNPNHRRLIASKDQLKYFFMHVDGEITVEFIKKKKKIGVTVIFKSHRVQRKLRESCDYNEISVENCCNDLITRIKQSNEIM